MNFAQPRKKDQKIIDIDQVLRLWMCFFVESTSKSFEASFDEAFDALINQLKRKKEKQLA